AVMFGMVVCYNPGWSKPKGSDCSSQVRSVIDNFQKKRYNAIIAIVTEMRKNCIGHPSMDTALYFLGRAYLQKNQPAEARVELETLLQDYPNSVYREEATYFQGYCSFKQSPSYEHDQARTLDAIRELSEFAEMYPTGIFSDSARNLINQCSEKLAKKEYMNARFYERIEQYESAIVYYKNFIRDFPASSYCAESKLSLAKNLVKLKRTTEAVAVLNDLIESEAGADIRKQARQMLDLIKSDTTG
ncbi:MAG: outer membrane protein assembly factor BamD, partial [Chitinivibrionales bacterium]|nr:outer membrane protein assembly factor BamD [Chitinivibrionales bacterium]